MDSKRLDQRGARGALAIAVAIAMTMVLACSASKQTDTPPPDSVEEHRAVLFDSEVGRKVVADVRARVGGAVLPTSEVRFQKQRAVLKPMGNLLPKAGLTAKRALVTLPELADGAFRIHDPESGLHLDIALEGARPERALSGDGYVSYPNALGRIGDGIHGHVLFRVHPEGAEDYVAFERAPEKPELRYRVRLGDGVAGLRLVDGVLEFLDAHGAPRLRVARPYVAAGERRAPASISWKVARTTRARSPPGIERSRLLRPRADPGRVCS